MSAIRPRDITGIILAGGRGDRMGGLDKGLQTLAGEPLVVHVARRLRPQVGPLLLSCRGNAAAYRALGFDTFDDDDADSQGPGAGLIAALRHTATPWALVVAVDMPLLPLDLALRLAAALPEGGSAAVADDGERLQHLALLVRRSALPGLEQAFAEGRRSLRSLLECTRPGCARAPWPAHAFLNLNTPGDLALAERLLADAARR